MTTLTMLWRAAGLLAIHVALAACTPSGAPPTDAAARSQSAAPIGRLDAVVSPTHYDIELSIDPAEERFAGRVAIDIEISEQTQQIWLHGKGLDVMDVYLSRNSGERIDASYAERLDSGVALVSLSEAADPGPARVHFSYSAPFNTSTNALFKVQRDGNDYAATQFQPIGARQVFPGFDEPGFKVPFDLTLVTRENHVAVTTTPLRSSELLADGDIKHTFETTRPLPTYLLAFAVGDYDIVDFGAIAPNAIREREVALRGVAARGLGDRMNYALKNTEGLLAVLEEYFGSPYPYRKLDIIAIPESFGGAMENVGAITYDEFLVLMDETSPLDQRRAYTSVHAHEMGHMWFGNLVTPEWWNDIWLNESFATWIMYKAAHSYWPEGEFERETLKGALGAMAADSLAAARQIREPIDDNNKIGGAFDSITYQKGGGVLAMLERYVGEDKFRAGIRLHMNRHRDGTATAEDFIASIAEGSDRVEIEEAFQSFVEQPGVPLVSVALDCSDKQSARVVVSQSRYQPLGSAIVAGDGNWQIPMCVRYSTGASSESTCTLLRDEQQEIDLDADSCPTLLHPNADGAGYYRFAMDEAGWQALIDQAAALAPAEALVFADSLDAAFRAGKLPANTYVAGLAGLVEHATWDVADAAIDYLEGVTSIVADEQLPPIEAALRKIVKPRFAQLEGESGPGSDLLRQRMQRFLIVIAKDQAMREPLAKRAAARLGLGQEADPSAADASELETIFSIGVQDIGEPFFDLLMAQAVAADDPAFRGAATGALARVEDPALVARLQNAIVEQQFKGTEMVGIVFRQMVRAATTELTYQWLRANDEAVIEMIPETFRPGTVPALGGFFCTVKRAEEWRTFVESHADALPGYQRNLEQAIESIHLCAALREATATTLVAAFEEMSE